MKIIIGRESDKRRLSVIVDGKQMFYGNEGSVPMDVSREHCVIEVDADGLMKIQNKTPANITYVDGYQVASKKITKKSRVELGAGKYQLDLFTIINNLVPKEYSLAHLEKVWNDYHDQTLEMTKNERKKAAFCRLQGVFSLMSMLLIFVKTDNDIINNLRFVCIALGLVWCVYSFIQSYRASERIPELTEKLKEDFESNYVCPNPDCKRFMGSQKYNILKQMKKCPYCGSKFIQ